MGFGTGGINVSESKRPCIVTLGFGKKKTKEEATFHGIYQRAHTTGGMLAGNVSGQYAEPVAVVEVWGRLRRKKNDNHRFKKW